MNARRLLVPALAGAVVGTLGDRIHTYFGVLYYPHPFAFGEAAWVPALMAGAGVAMVGGHSWMRRLLHERASGGGAKPVAVALAWFAAAYLASGVFRAYPVSLMVAYTAVFVGRILRPGARSQVALAHAMGTALLGSLFEAGLSATGAFAYTEPDLLGVPLWLPGLYLHAALLARAVDRSLPA